MLKYSQYFRSIVPRDTCSAGVFQGQPAGTRSLRLPLRSIQTETGFASRLDVPNCPWSRLGRSCSVLFTPKALPLRAAQSQPCHTLGARAGCYAGITHFHTAEPGVLNTRNVRDKKLFQNTTCCIGATGHTSR